MINTKFAFTLNVIYTGVKERSILVAHKINKFTMMKFLFEAFNNHLRRARECNLVDCYPNNPKTRQYQDDYYTLSSSESDYYEDIYEDLAILTFVDPTTPAQDISMMVTDLQNKALAKKPNDHIKQINHLLHLNYLYMKKKHLIGNRKKKE